MTPGSSDSQWERKGLCILNRFPPLRSSTPTALRNHERTFHTLMYVSEKEERKGRELHSLPARKLTSWDANLNSRLGEMQDLGIGRKVLSFYVRETLGAFAAHRQLAGL